MNATMAVSTNAVSMIGDLFSVDLVGQIPALRRRALRLTGQEPDADDLVQETVMRALERRAQFRPGSNLRAWLFTIQRSLFINAYRRRRNVAAMGSLEDEDLYGSGKVRPTSSAEETTLDNLMDEDLRAALAALPEHYRDAVLLRDVAQCSYAEVAAHLDCAPGTVMSRLHRGRAMLRRTLEQRWAQGSTQRESAYAQQPAFKAA